MSELSLSLTRPDFEDILQQLSADVSTRGAWAGNVETQTGQQLLRLIAAIGAFDQAKIRRALEDAFPETAVSDRAVRALAAYQGIRLPRKLPTSVDVTMTCPTAVTIPPLTAFQGGGSYFFNRTAIQLSAGVPLPVTLYQGILVTKEVNGLGQDYSLFASVETDFVVSDVDVYVWVNAAPVERTTSGLWEFPGRSGFVDRTLPDGRLLIEFGNSAYGARPGVNDSVKIVYATTAGADGSSFPTTGKKLNCEDFSTVVAAFTSNPTGGGDERSVALFKNVAAPTFGTFGSAITRAQYLTTAMAYPGIVDVAMFAQRETNPMFLTMMNVIRVIPLTSTVWDQDDIDDFVAYLESKTTFGPRFLVETPLAVPTNVSMDVYCYNYANSSEAQSKATAAVTELFALRQGRLDFEVYPSDIITAVKGSYPGIEYVVLNQPVGPTRISSRNNPLMYPDLALANESVNPLPPEIYEYGVQVEYDGGTVSAKRFPGIVVTVGKKVVVSFAHQSGITKYSLIRRVVNTSFMAIVAELTVTTQVVGSTISFNDVSTNTAIAAPVPWDTKPIRYATLGTLTVNSRYSTRQVRAL